MVKEFQRQFDHAPLLPLELLKTRQHLNHFARKARLHGHALPVAFAELQHQQPVTLAA